MTVNSQQKMKTQWLKRENRRVVVHMFRDVRNVGAVNCYAPLSHERTSEVKSGSEKEGNASTVVCIRT